MWKFCNNIQQVDTLIKYLVDSLQSYESGHGDALHPIPLNSEKTFMGDDLALKPVTNHEFYWFKNSLDEKLDAIVISTAALATGNYAGPERTQTLINQSQTQIRHSPYGNISESASASISLANPVENSGCTLPVNGLATTTVTVQRTLNLPISEVLVPDLGHSSGAWKRAIKQWEEYDPMTKCALKDWPKDWYTGVMRTVTGSKRSQRQIVFEEYERYKLFFFFWVDVTATHRPLYKLSRLGRSESQFLEEYPEADKSLTHLLKSIHAKTNWSQSSKKS